MERESYGLEKDTQVKIKEIKGSPERWIFLSFKREHFDPYNFLDSTFFLWFLNSYKMTFVFVTQEI